MKKKRAKQHRGVMSVELVGTLVIITLGITVLHRECFSLINYTTLLKKKQSEMFNFPQHAKKKKRVKRNHSR